MNNERNIAELLEEIALLKEQIDHKDKQISLKNEQILLLQRQLFGRRSEKRLPVYDKAQFDLFSLQEKGTNL